MRLLLVLAVIFAFSPARADDCTEPLPGTCYFYRLCLDQRMGCGEHGYAVGYGEKYCLRFNHEDRLSELGVSWRDATLTCLQKSLVPLLGAEELSCGKITEAGFASHVA